MNRKNYKEGLFCTLPSHLIWCLRAFTSACIVAALMWLGLYFFYLILWTATTGSWSEPDDSSSDAGQFFTLNQGYISLLFPSTFLSFDLKQMIHETLSPATFLSSSAANKTLSEWQKPWVFFHRCSHLPEVISRTDPFSKKQHLGLGKDVL